MKKLSIGLDNTLENWIKLSESAFGKNSEPVKYLRNLANESPNGLQEEVLADEGQLLMVLGQIHQQEIDDSN